MNANVGPVDRLVRLIFGLVIVAMGLYFKSYWGLIGLVLLATSFLRWCPAYLPFGVSTCKRDANH